MKTNKQKVQDLQDLAGKAAEFETQKAEETQKNIRERKKAKNQSEIPEEGREEKTDDMPQTIEWASARKNNTPPLTNKRVYLQGVSVKLTEKDLAAIQDAKIYLLQQGFQMVANHRIIRAALRSLKGDHRLGEAYSNVCEEDGRRNHLSISK